VRNAFVLGRGNRTRDSSIAVGGFVDPDFPPPKISFFEKYKHPWVGFNHQPEHFPQRPTYPLWAETTL
jgi:hypothetical protein